MPFGLFGTELIAILPRIILKEVMIAEDYDDTKILTVFIRVFHFFDCFHQISITSDRNIIF